MFEAFLIVLSAGIFVAHGLDAYRSSQGGFPFRPQPPAGRCISNARPHGFVTRGGEFGFRFWLLSSALNPTMIN
jgi:hypothetical protein